MWIGIIPMDDSYHHVDKHQKEHGSYESSIQSSGIARHPGVLFPFAVHKFDPQGRICFDLFGGASGRFTNKGIGDWRTRDVMKMDER